MAAAGSSSNSNSNSISKNGTTNSENQPRKTKRRTISKNQKVFYGFVLIVVSIVFFVDRPTIGRMELLHDASTIVKVEENNNNNPNTNINNNNNNKNKNNNNNNVKGQNNETNHPMVVATTSRNEIIETQNTMAANITNINNTTTNNNNNNSSQVWFPSSEWIETCVAEETPKSLEAGPFRDPFPLPLPTTQQQQRRLRRKKKPKKSTKANRFLPMNDQIIGDCIKHCMHCGKYVPPTSFNGMFTRLACRNKYSDRDVALEEELGLTGPNTNVTHNYNAGNFELVEAIHRYQEEQEAYLFPRPPKDALVIHLRLGDIVEGLREAPSEILANGGTPSNHKGDPDSFKNAIKSVYEILENVYESGVRQVEIRGGSHYANQFQKSRVYANCLYRAIRDAGYDNDNDTVGMTIEGTPAEVDFFYISHATQLVVGPGGYSHLMGKLVERRGGKIVGRSFGLLWG